MTSGTRVYQALAADATIVASVSTRIYPVKLPEDPTLPAIVYQLVSGRRDGNLEGDAGLAHPTFQIDVYDEDYDDAETLQVAVRDCLVSELKATATEPRPEWDPEPERFRCLAEYTFSVRDDE